MFKILRIFVLVVILIVSIYFESISKYISKEYVSHITYGNYEIKIPNKFVVDSISYKDTIYLYGLFPRNNISKSENIKNEKKYLFSFANKDWINIFITNEKFDMSQDKSFINITKNFNIFKDIKLHETILNYNNTKFYYLKVNKLYFLTIPKNDSKITIMVNKIRDKKILSKHLLNLIENINK